MKNTCLFMMLLLLASCITPNTQPVIEGVLEWKKLEDAELQKHRDLAAVAKFSEDPVKNADSKAAYRALIDRHGNTVDAFANTLVTWAQRVGQFDEAYANRTLDQMITIYLELRDK
tara:strand:+ start:437 stop:784 length:348 start_codon:yes stop_codon:yes gene_type:complete